MVPAKAGVQLGVPLDSGFRRNDERVKRNTPAFLALALLFGAALRLVRCTGWEPWLDEACSVHYASLPWAALWDAFRTESHPPLYYVMLKGWLQVFGPSPLSIRLLSVLPGVALIPVVGALASRLARSPACPEVSRGVPDSLALLLAALSPVAIYAASEARQYAWLAFLVALSVERGLAWLESGRPVHLAGYLAAATLALYTHYYAAFVLPLVPLAAWALNSRRTWRQAAWLVAPALAFLPWGLAFVGGSLGDGSKAWLPLAWLLAGVGLPLLASMLGRPLVLPGRYDVVALPAVLLLLAQGLGAAWSAALIVVLASWMRTDSFPSFQATHQLLKRQQGAVAQVVAVGFTWAPLAYQERVEPTGVALHAVPRDLTAHPGWWDQRAPVEVQAQVARPAPGRGELWLVSQPGGPFDRWTTLEQAALQEAGWSAIRGLKIGDVFVETWGPGGAKRPPDEAARARPDQ
jgi:4-amino-4-deoxy-L-arabinose transferase-like glycosyltransferase